MTPLDHAISSARKSMNTFVIVNGKKIPTNKVKFLDIEEDIQGRDHMTFEFQGKVYSSLVYSG